MLRRLRPDEPRELLLQAALGPKARAVDCWEKFIRDYGLDGVDESQFRMLPLAGHNLARHGYECPQSGHLKGIHRQAWYRNQMLFHRLAPLVRDLQDRGIPVMVLKGAAVATLYYPDPGLRPMRDMDLLVREEDFFGATEVLERSGWTVKTPGAHRRGQASYRRFRHAIAYANSSGQEIDLHWHALYYARDASTDAVFLESAVPLEIQGVKLMTPDATRHFLHTCIHGADWDEIPTIRWITDAMMILRRGAIEWDWILRFTIANRLGLPMRAALEYLTDRFEAPIPGHVLDSIRSIRPSRLDLAEFDRMTSASALQTVPHTIRAVFRSHQRSCLNRPFLSQAAHFPAYMAHYWDVDGFGDAVHRASRWIGRRLA